MTEWPQGWANELVIDSMNKLFGQCEMGIETTVAWWGSFVTERDTDQKCDD